MPDKTKTCPTCEKLIDAWDAPYTPDTYGKWMENMVRVFNDARGEPDPTCNGEGTVMG